MLPKGSLFYKLERRPMNTLKEILKWLVGFFILSLVFFILVRMIPGNPVDRLLDCYQLPRTEANVAFLKKSFGLDKPLLEQYRYWISHFIQGDWGRSYVTGREVRAELFKRMPLSLSIGLGGVCLGGVLAFFLGYLAACRPRGFWDKFTRFLTVFVQSVPTFMLAVFVIYLLSVKYQIVKVYSNYYLSIFLAMLFVALQTTGDLCRLMRSHFLEIKKTPYIYFSRCRGFRTEGLLLRDGARPACIALLSSIVSRFSWVIGGTSVVEFLFALPGVSLFLIQSIAAKDYNIIQSYLLFIFLWMALVHLIFNGIIYLLKGGLR